MIKSGFDTDDPMPTDPRRLLRWLDRNMPSDALDWEPRQPDCCGQFEDPEGWDYAYVDSDADSNASSTMGYGRCPDEVLELETPFHTVFSVVLEENLWAEHKNPTLHTNDILQAVRVYLSLGMLPLAQAAKQHLEWLASTASTKRSRKRLDETVRAANIAIDERIRFQQRNITTTVANDDLADRLQAQQQINRQPSKTSNATALLDARTVEGEMPVDLTPSELILPQQTSRGPVASTALSKNARKKASRLDAANAR